MSQEGITRIADVLLDSTSSGLAGRPFTTGTTIPMEVEPMETTVKKAIEQLAEKLKKDDVKSEDAMRFSQSALNLAHVLATFDNMNKPR